MKLRKIWMRLQAKNIGRYADMRFPRIGILILAAFIAWGTKGIHKDPLMKFLSFSLVLKLII